MARLRLASNLVALCIVSAAAVACSATTNDLSDDADDQGGSGAGTNDGAGDTGGAPSNGGAGGGTTNEGGTGPGCGNNVRERGEACDGSDLGGVDCLGLGYSNAVGTTCNSECNLEFGGCEPTCDGALLEPDEQCDGEDLGGADCSTLGYVNPVGLACGAGCADFNTSGCVAECGNDVAEPNEECDGADVPVSCTDFGFSAPTADEPRCIKGCLLDSSGCEATCGDNLVEPTELCDDGNLTNNDGCSSTCRPDGTTCAAAFPIALGAQQIVVTGTTVGGGGFDTTEEHCENGSPGPGRVLAITAEVSGFLTAWTDRPATEYDSVLFVRTSCDDDGTTLLCADNRGDFLFDEEGGGDVLSVPVTQGQTLYLVIGGSQNDAEGDFNVVLDLSVGSTCNDPVPFPVFPGTTMLALGATINQSLSTGGTCGGGSSNSGASDVVYRIERRNEDIGVMDIELPTALTDYDALLYARFDCANTGQANEIACADEPFGGELMSLGFNTNNVRFVWVDGFQGAEGNYGLSVTPGL